MMATIQRFGGRLSKWKCGVKRFHSLRKYERLGQMADTPTEPLASQGALPGAPVDWNRPWPIRFAHERVRVRARFSPGTDQDACARATRCRRSERADDRGRTEASCQARLPRVRSGSRFAA